MNHISQAEEAQDIALLGTAHIVRSFLQIVSHVVMTRPKQTLLNSKFLTPKTSFFHVTLLHTVSIIIYTPFEQFDTKF